MLTFMFVMTLICSLLNLVGFTVGIFIAWFRLRKFREFLKDNDCT